MTEGAELHLADFGLVGEDYTMSPTTSVSPSMAPSTLHDDNVGYIVRYAGEIRTIVRWPFQIDKTGEVLPMDGTRKYRLCGSVNEMQGSEMRFLVEAKVSLDRRCLIVYSFT